jgi:hypothetical protein
MSATANRKSARVQQLATLTRDSAQKRARLAIDAGHRTHTTPRSRSVRHE